MGRGGIGKMHLAWVSVVLWSCFGCTIDLSLSQITSSNLSGPNLPIALSPGDFPIGKMDFYLKEAFFYEPTVGGHFLLRDSTDPNCNLRTVDSNFQLVSCFDAGDVAGLTVDAAGNVFVGNPTTNEIKKFDKDGNLLLTFGGPGATDGLFNSPVDIALDAGGNIYVVDRANYRVQKFDTAGNFILAFGNMGAGDGQFSLPYGVAVTPAGDILVADSGNHRIQKFSPLGVYISKFGSAAALDGALQLPMNMAVDVATGDVYVADFFQKVILKYDSGGVFQWKTAAAIDISAQVALIGGEIVVPDNNRIVYFSTAGAFLREKKPQGSPFQTPFGLAMSATHHFYVGDGTQIKEFDYQGQSVRTFGAFASAVGGIAVNKDGNIFATDITAGTLKKFNSSGVLLGTYSGTGTGAAQLYNPMGLMIHDDVVYVCDTYNLRIQMFSTAGVHLGSFGDASGPGQLIGPMGITLATDNHFYISVQNGPIYKYDFSGNFVGTWGTHNGSNTVTDFDFATGIYSNQDGEIYVIDNHNQRITKFNTSGTYLATIGSFGGLPGNLHSPAGIIGDAWGNIYVVETDNQRIQKFDGSGVVQSQ
jgi:tripartite motif-containing protein 71